MAEKAMVDSGIILLKYWLEVSPEEQTRRLEGVVEDGRKTWKPRLLTHIPSKKLPHKQVELPNPYDLR